MAGRAGRDHQHNAPHPRARGPATIGRAGRGPAAPRLAKLATRRAREATGLVLVTFWSTGLAAWAIYLHFLRIRWTTCLGVVTRSVRLAGDSPYGLTARIR
ncbi:hypothetical protein OJF2_62900 [Aquisphaera giovannonii]|uniref:Uncharacterized protein n=1 Tax=Aquisphaera giovannonii TaxID=406548 RepID=A0A5B9WBV0_9BACT|nr:hypothetical protein OJF2_62900 [Aquisphaera giovannonii]